MKIEDITPQEFSGHRDFENRIKLKVFPVANKSTAGFVYFDKGWLHVPTWFPVSSDGLTCKRMFAYYKDEKYTGIYDPGVRPPLDANSAGLEGLFAIGGDNNYWHFMMELVPRLVLLDAPELQDRPIAHTLTQRHLEFSKTVLERIGITRKTFIEAGPEKPVGGEAGGIQFISMKDTVVPTKMFRDIAVLLWDTRLWPLKERPPSKGRKLFVIRGEGDRRQCLNRAELGQVLEREGFETVNPGMLSIPDQMQLFAESKCIVAEHGAALTNLLFTPPDCRVVEVFNGLMQPFLADLAGFRRFDHRLVKGRPDRKTIDSGLITHHSDYTVDSGEILRFVKS